MAYTAEQYLSVKRNTAGGCTLTKAEADQLGEMMEQTAALLREQAKGAQGEAAWFAEGNGTWNADGGVFTAEVNAGEWGWINCCSTDERFAKKLRDLVLAAPRAAVPDAFAPIPEMSAPTPELWQAYQAFNETYRGMNTQQALRVAINGVLENRAAMLSAAPSSPSAKLCANCDAPLPKGCGGCFKDERECEGHYAVPSDGGEHG
ncbi:MAG: hypothetical protein ACTHMK_13905 [Dyella sp.]|uniref:hypothetical protein n=1 Tax=Dyella sp. TaxID=1869338 RepID=UPI003F81255D